MPFSWMTKNSFNSSVKNLEMYATVSFRYRSKLGQLLISFDIHFHEFTNYMYHMKRYRSDSCYECT